MEPGKIVGKDGTTEAFDVLVSFPPYVASTRYEGLASDDRGFLRAHPKTRQLIHHPDISVVVAYGHMLPSPVIDLPRLGTINIHASLLPLLRGAAPIQAAIREGHTETGITIMRMVRALDAGPSILQVRTPIPDDETYGELELRLAELGAMALIEALTLIDLGKAAETPQDASFATYARKTDRAQTRIDWSTNAITAARRR